MADAGKKEKRALSEESKTKKREHEQQVTQFESILDRNKIAGVSREKQSC